MSTPEEEIRFAEAFNELGESAELMVEPPTAAAIRGKVRRRRATRVTVAAIAALALVAPASWMLQQAATADERDEPVIAEVQTTEPAPGEESVKPQEPTPSVEPSPDSEETFDYDDPPTFDELVGTTLDLPSFVPGAGIDEVCPVDGAVLEDGRTGGYMDGGGRIGLLEVVHTPMGEGGRDFPVLLLGCRFGEAAAYQVVLLDQSEGTGEWYTWTQLSHSVMNADRPYDIAADPDYGVLVAVAERYICCDGDPDAIDYWVERTRLNDVSETVTERLDEDEVDGAFTNLSVTVEATEDSPGEWTVSVLVANQGDEVSADYLLTGCAGAGLFAQTEFDFAACGDGKGLIEEISALEPGDEQSFSWEVTLAPEAEWTDGSSMSFEIDLDATGEPGLARDLVIADNWGFFNFGE